MSRLRAFCSPTKAKTANQQNLLDSINYKQDLNIVEQRDPRLYVENVYAETKAGTIFNIGLPSCQPQIKHLSFHNYGPLSLAKGDHDITWNIILTSFPCIDTKLGVQCRYADSYRYDCQDKFVSLPKRFPMVRRVCKINLHAYSYHSPAAGI